MSHSVMSLFISTMRPFDNNERNNLKNWNTKAEMWEKRLLLKFNREFRPVESAFSSKAVLGKNGQKDALRKWSLRNTGHKSSAQEVKIINLDGLEEALLPEKRTWTA